jgi:hypothetical protein
MISTDITKYRSLDLSELPIFYQPVWLDVAAKDRWEIRFVEEQDKIVSVMPLVWSSTDRNKLMMPALTPYLGPYFSGELTKEKNATKNSKIHKVLEEFISSIPGCDYFEQCWHPESNMWLPFLWEGYQQTTKYTYLLNIQDIDGDGTTNFRQNIKRDIKKATSKLSLETSDRPDDIITMVNKTFTRQKIMFPYDKEMLVNMISKLCDEKKGKIYLVRDNDSVVHSAAFIVWDNNKAYYILGGSNPDLRNSGSMSFLFFNIFKETSKFVSQFDFEGSCVKNIERYFRGFGGQPVPYFQISKVNSRVMQLKHAAVNLLKVLKS